MPSFLPLLLLFSLAPASALELVPVLDVDLAASYWDEGARLAASPGLQARLWGADDSLLFGSTFLRLDTIAEVTPSYARLGPRLTFSPIAVFETSAHYVGSAYFGTFSSIKGFDDPDAVYTDEVLEPIPRDSGWGSRWGVEATLQGQVGPIVAAAWAELQGWEVQPGDAVSGRYFWEPQCELLIGFSDITWTANGVLLYTKELDEDIGRKLYVGGVYGEASSVETGDRYARAGLLSNFSLNRSWGFLLTVQPYLVDRVYTSPLPPYVAGRVRWTWQKRAAPNEG